MRFDEPLNHPPLPISYSRHLNVETVDADPELFAAPNIVRDLRRMNDVLTWKTCDVRTGSTDVLPFHDCDALASTREGPGQQFRACATTKDEKIVSFGF